MQIIGHALAFLFLHQYFRLYPFLLQADVPAMVTDDGDNKKSNNDRNQQGNNADSVN